MKTNLTDKEKMIAGFCWSCGNHGDDLGQMQEKLFKANREDAFDNKPSNPFVIVHQIPTIEIKKDGKHLLKASIRNKLDFDLVKGGFIFDGWPIEVTITLPSGHSETWIENVPDLDDYLE